MDRDLYAEPLVSRYTSRAMQELFSENTKFRTWRRCWIALAEAERELGLGDIDPRSSRSSSAETTPTTREASRTWTVGWE